MARSVRSARSRMKAAGSATGALTSRRLSSVFRKDGGLRRGPSIGSSGMKFSGLLLIALMPLAAFGQKKEQFVEMQRDIAQLQDQVRTLQRTQDEKLAQLT